MQAILLFPRSGFCGISSNSWWASAKSRVVHGKEFADVALHIGSCSIIRAEGQRRAQPRRGVSSGRAEKVTSKLMDFAAANNATSRSNHDEIMALFKRIQSSISKGGSAVSRQRNSSISREEKQSAESVVGTLREYPRREQTKARTQTLQENKGSSHRSATLEDEGPRDVKMSRPPSSFIKKSPIPPVQSKENGKEEFEEKSSQNCSDEMLQKMKLTELKELAKTKGVKGYSKLKKGELLDLLKKVLQSPT